MKRSTPAIPSRDQRVGSSTAEQEYAAARDRVKALLEDLEKSELRQRYEIGVLVVALRDEKATYGKQAVERLANDLGWDSATLYRYASVVDRLPERKMKRVSELRDTKGRLLSWSHLVELIKAPSFDAWMERSLKSAWSVRELAGEIAKVVPPPDAETRQGKQAKDPTVAALMLTVSEAEKWRKHLVNSLRFALDRVIEESTAGSQEVREAVDKLLTAFDSARSEMEDMEAQLRAVRSRRDSGVQRVARPRETPADRKVQ